MSSMGKKEAGFTLVELMVSMAIVGIVMASIYSSYYSQQKSYVTQEQLAIMQQNLRAALFHLERDIRMAGYDPTGKAESRILAATSPTLPSPPVLQFTKDENKDGDSVDANENVEYSYVPSSRRLIKTLRTPSATQTQTIAENIDVLSLVYLDEAGAPTTTPNRIRSVQICIVARTSRPDPGYSDPNVYRNLQGAPIYTPTGSALSFRRKMLRVEVQCRNIGI